MTELTYTQRNALAQELDPIINRYFNDVNFGRCEPVVTFFEYDLLHYTFKMSCRTYSCSACYVLRYEKRNDLNAFRKEVRDCLKRHGFKRIKFDILSQKYSYDRGGVYQTDTRKVLTGIYFDW